MEIKNTAAVILAAGISARMKTPKALLGFKPGVTFLEKIASVYFQWGCSEIIAVANEATAGLMKKILSLPAHASIIVNDHLEYERFYSLKLGLEKVKEAEFCFFQNVDNPFIDEDILNAIYNCRSGDAFVSPVFEGQGGHPVLLNRKNMDFIRNYHINDANLKLVLNGLTCKKVELSDNKVLININSPEEYERIFSKR